MSRLSTHRFLCWSSKCRSRGDRFEKRILAFTTIFLIAFLAPSKNAICQSYYQVVDLGALTPSSGTPNSLARDVNSFGQAVGLSGVNQSHNHAVIFSDDGPVDLGDLVDGQTTTSWANGLNDHLEIVGLGVAQNGQDHSTFWSAKTGLIDLHPKFGFLRSEARAINNDGIIAGLASSNPPFSVPVRWVDGAIEQLRGFPGTDERGFATSINKHGQIAGTFFAGPSWAHAFVWTDGQVQEIGDVGGGANR